MPSLPNGGVQLINLLKDIERADLAQTIRLRPSGVETGRIPPLPNGFLLWLNFLFCFLTLLLSL